MTSDVVECENCGSPWPRRMAPPPLGDSTLPAIKILVSRANAAEAESAAWRGLYLLVRAAAAKACLEFAMAPPIPAQSPLRAAMADLGKALEEKA